MILGKTPPSGDNYLGVVIERGDGMGWEIRTAEGILGLGFCVSVADCHSGYSEESHSPLTFHFYIFEILRCIQDDKPLTQ